MMRIDEVADIMAGNSPSRVRQPSSDMDSSSERKRVKPKVSAKGIMQRKLSKTIEAGLALVPLAADREKFSGFVEEVMASRRREDIVLTPRVVHTFAGLIDEYRNSDLLRRHGLPIRSKVLFCGPPGCGKTATAEVFARELGLPLIVARLDTIISSFLGETATNLRKVFQSVERQPAVLFLDEFDALARSRDDISEHNEMRRVVNSLLMLIEKFHGRGFIVAATNLEGSLDPAIWRRFDEVIVFDPPKDRQIRQFLRLKTKNFPAEFQLDPKIEIFRGWSYAEIERVCVSAIKRCILKKSKALLEAEFDACVRDERSRREVCARV